MGLLRKAITSNPSIPQGKGDFGPAKPAPSPLKGTDEAVREALLNYGLNNQAYQGIVLDMPKDAGQDKAERYFSLVSFMVASFGNAIRLPSNCALILLPGTRDRQLIGHRLARTLRTNALADFEAENTDQALSRIQSFL
jgi:hypothetical protein